MHVDIYRAIIVRSDAVDYDLSVTITQFVVLVDDELLVFFVLFFNELFSTEEICQLVLFVGLLHDTLQLLVCQDSITINDNAMYLNLFLLVNHDVYIDLVFVTFDVSFDDVYFSILETLVIKMSLDDDLGTVNQVWSNLATLCQTQLGFQIFTFAFLHAMIMDIGNTRTLRKDNLQENLVVDYLFRFNSYIREQTMTPIALDGSCDFIARYCDGLTNRQSR